jgi:hypothetical protein
MSLPSGRGRGKWCLEPFLSLTCLIQISVMRCTNVAESA